MPISPSPRSGNSDDGQCRLTATSEVDGAVIVLTPHGQWDWRLFLDLYTAVQKYLAECPPALIIDLHHLVDPTTASAPLWLTARRNGAALRPPVDAWRRQCGGPSATAARWRWSGLPGGADR